MPISRSTTLLVFLLTLASAAEEWKRELWLGLTPRSELLIRRSGDGVRLASASVSVTLSRDHALVDAVFELANTGGATSVEVAFPGIDTARTDEPLRTGPNYIRSVAGASADLGPRKGPPRGPYIDRCEVDIRVDGEAVATAFREREVVIPPGARRPFFYCHVWSIPFDGVDRRKVRVRYRERAVRWLWRRALEQKSFAYSFAAAGKTWPGPIDSLTFELELKDIDLANLVEVFPHPVSIKDGKKLRWSFQDFDPGEVDAIEILYRPFQSAEDFVRNGSDRIESWFDAWVLAYHCNHSVGDFGRVDAIVSKGLARLAEEGSISPWCPVALHHQKAIARAAIHEADPSPRNAELLRHSLDALLPAVAAASDHFEKEDLSFEDTSSPLCRWILSTEIKRRSMFPWYGVYSYGHFWETALAYYARVTDKADR